MRAFADSSSIPSSRAVNQNCRQCVRLPPLPPPPLRCRCSSPPWPPALHTLLVPLPAATPLAPQNLLPSSQSRGFEVYVHGWLAVVSYCPSINSELNPTVITKYSDWLDGGRCTSANSSSGYFPWPPKCRRSSAIRRPAAPMPPPKAPLPTSRVATASWSARAPAPLASPPPP